MAIISKLFTPCQPFGVLWRFHSLICGNSVRLFVAILFGYLWRFCSVIDAIIIDFYALNAIGSNRALDHRILAKPLELLRRLTRIQFLMTAFFRNLLKIP